MQRKIGAGHAEAMLRLGLKELRNAFNPSQGSVADTEIGLYGTATQGEIATERAVETGLDAEQEMPKESLADKIKAAAARDNDKGQDKGMSR